MFFDWIIHPTDKMQKGVVLIISVAVVIAAMAVILFVQNEGGNNPESSGGIVDAVTDDPNREYPNKYGRLWIVGNANFDDVLDERDVEWIEKIIEGTANEAVFNAGLSQWSVDVRLADANQDGVVDQKDVEKVKSMIETTPDSPKQKIFYVDVDGALNSMHFPAKTILTGYEQNSKQLQTLHALDMVVACDVSSASKPYAKDILNGVPAFSYSGTFNPEAEMIMSYSPDIIVTGTQYHYCKGLEEALPKERTNMDIVRISSWEDGKTIEGTLTLGFMICKNKEAQAYAEWADHWIDLIDERVSKLSEDDIVSILMPRGEYEDWNVTMNAPRGGKFETSILAGANNIIVRNLTSDGTNVVVSDEWVRAQTDLDYIVCIVYGGLDDSEKFGYTNHSFYEEAKKYWADMNAAYGTEIHVLDNMVGQGTTYVIGAVYMAKWFYPELFKDMNPDEIFQGFLDEFFQYDFDVATYQATGGIAI